jgi:hypothetical protein
VAASHVGRIANPSYDLHRDGGFVMNLSQTLRSLSHRNFRLFFIGQSVSLIGTWMQQVAMSWVVYELTRTEG